MDSANPAVPSASSRVSLTTASLEELQELVAPFGQPAYRARQLYEWIQGRHVRSFEEMTNLPKSFRETLATHFTIALPTVRRRRVAEDGAIKYVLDFGDVVAETVAIPTDKRLTVCFSTQAGCAMGCLFCATGQTGLRRNLTAGEMVDQLIVVERDFQTNEEITTPAGHDLRISNAVAMGQGEPFANYDELLRALRLMNDPEGFSIGARKLTVSTCGLIRGIERFAQEPEQFGLAVSLHSAVQKTRDQLMPGVKSQPLTALKAALLAYEAATNRRVTLEYALIASVNDDPESFEALVAFCKGGRFHINLLPLHPVDGVALRPSSDATITQWERELNARGIAASRRQSRGVDIDGACGQLANK